MLSEELQKKIDLLPKHIVDMIYGTDLVYFVIETRKKNGLNQDQIDNLNAIILDVFMKEIRIENLVDTVKNELKISEDTAKEISFTFMSSFLYKAKDFFPGLEDEILNLGGEIPKNNAISLSQQFAKREEEIEKMQEKRKEKDRKDLLDSTTYGKINDLMKKFPEVGEQYIGSKESIQVVGMPVAMKPMIKYWIKDYMIKAGHGKSSNLDRVQYVCHDKNTRKMNSEERSQLMMVLKSADGEIDLPYSGKIRKIDFSLIKED